jgi:hypothetical protein
MRAQWCSCLSRTKDRGSDGWWGWAAREQSFTELVVVTVSSSG